MDSEEVEENVGDTEEEPNQATVQRLLEERCAQLEYQVTSLGKYLVMFPTLKLLEPANTYFLIVKLIDFLK